MLDALIVGAGPAGLTAALYLARYRRRLRLVDAGDSRARYIPVSHNTPGFARGVGGEALLAELREQAARYGARAEAATVRELARAAHGFVATIGGETVQAANVVLATGVVDTLPALPGVEAAVHAGLVRICPVCDAYETTGKRVAVYGAPDAACAHARYLRTFCTGVTAICDAGQRLPPALRQQMLDAGIEVLEDVASLAIEDGAVVVTAADGGRHRFDALYPFLGAAARSELATALGATVDAGGELEVDRHQQTSVPGLYAVGDIVSGLNQISVAVGQAALAATAIHNRLPHNPM
jgi:thioredoxin reductase (NADPH)